MIPEGNVCIMYGCNLVSAVRAAYMYFYHLRHIIRRVRQSLYAESAATLVHAFVTSRVDYCNAIGRVAESHNRQVAACDEL